MGSIEEPNPNVYDVIVVGSGNAALCSALSAQETGARVLILEAAPKEERGGNSRYAGTVYRCVHSAVLRGADAAVRNVHDFSVGANRLAASVSAWTVIVGGAARGPTDPVRAA